jgi:hypothetical protein
MKRILYFLSLLAGMLLACNIPASVTPTVATLPPVQQPTDTSVPATPTQATATPQANVVCNNVSLHLEASLASGFQCATLPETSGQGSPAFAVNPQTTEITFQGYVLSGRFFEAHIDVYPVQRYSEIAPDANIPDRVAALQGLIAGGAPGAGGLPMLPVFNAAQELHAQLQVVPFASGSGIRYLTQYAQFADPINNHELFYTYQGLSADGKDWISAILPTSMASLPADGNTPPNGQSAEQFSNGFNSYLADMTTQLNAQAPGAFAPTLAQLDMLISSLNVTP